MPPTKRWLIATALAHLHSCCVVHATSCTCFVKFSSSSFVELGSRLVFAEDKRFDCCCVVMMVICFAFLDVLIPIYWLQCYVVYARKMYNNDIQRSKIIISCSSFRSFGIPAHTHVASQLGRLSLPFLQSRWNEDQLRLGMQRYDSYRSRINVWVCR